MAAPIGNVNAMRNKPFAEAINRAIAQDDGVRLRAIAEALLTKAADGDMAAIREFADRLDGKAVQQVSGAGENGEFITKMIVELVKANGS